MSEFSELIKSFDRIREYMRDFYLYGFKVRGEYTYKSARTYDNERRRLESWLSHYVRWDYSTRGKRVFLSVDSAHVPQNPLYAAWKSKSFTRSDLLLHFYLLDLLRDGSAHTVEQLTDAISRRYGQAFDSQTVRLKLKEYQRQGLLLAQKQGRALYYSMSPMRLETLPERQALLDACKFFQEVSPFGFVGSTLLDQQRTNNDLFLFKHHYIVHTLEDGILLQIISAMREKRRLTLQNHSRRTDSNTFATGVPLKILVSTYSGRRYLCLYDLGTHRFTSLRLDCITAVTAGEPYSDYEELRASLEHNLPACWGVSFGNRSRNNQLFLKLHIDEKSEDFLLERIQREGHGGELLRVEANTYLFSIALFDANEALPWIKTFTGRILALECTDEQVCKKFYRDMLRMYQMYSSPDTTGQKGGDGLGAVL